jgi:hypothetical protein
VPAYLRRRQARLVEPGFAYDSGSNPHFLTVAELRRLINEQLTPRSGVDRRKSVRAAA